MRREGEVRGGGREASYSTHRTRRTMNGNSEQDLQVRCVGVMEILCISRDLDKKWSWKKKKNGV